MTGTLRPRARLSIAGAIVALGLGASVATAATITVTSVSDAVNAGDGACTLREAIVAANTDAASGGGAGECAAGQAAPTVDAIVFAIPGTGVKTIAPASQLPAIAGPVLIDGYTQSGATPNTLPTGGSNAVLRIELDGTNAGKAPLLRFVTGSAGAEVRGLAVNRTAASAIHLGAVVRVAGSFIGTDATGTLPRGNDFHGIEIAAPGPGLIGGSSPADRNVIAYNGGAGVLVHPNATGWRIVGNATFGNADKGIALSLGALPRANDALDADTGANDGQNFPLIDSVTLTPTSVRVQGRVIGAPNRTLALDVYGSRPLTGPGRFLQGGTYLGAAPANVTTDAQGKATFDVTLPYTTDANLKVTATLTDVTGCASPVCGSTSEFAQRGVFRVAPRFASASGAVSVTVAGQLFQNGASVAFGATNAPVPTFVDAQRLDTTLPVLSPGTLYDVTVANPDGTSATMARAFVTDFTDVPVGSQWYPHVMNIAANGITTGCQAGQYCGTSEVARSQMAVFLMRGRHGPFFVPPPATGVFADVPVGSFAADWIELLRAEGVTTGCASGPLRYCPVDPVSRAQMAVFLLRTKYGASYVPPPCVGVFADVSCAAPKHPFADWIEQLRAEGITLGCASNPLRYCPEASVLREQMAAFLSRTFALSEGTNVAPGVTAGADQSIVLPTSSVTLIGAVTDDALPLPPGQLAVTWTKQSGPGTVTFGDPGATTTTATFSAAGTYVLRLTANDGALTTFDDVQVIVNAVPPPNQAPTVNAGIDQTITLPASASLSGSATDDGLPNPPGSVGLSWSKVSGPGTVTFGNATAAATTASFGVDGVYVLRLTANDGALSAFDDVQVTVQPAGAPPVLNPPPLDPSVPTNTPESTAFLYTGPNAVQTGVAPGTIQLARAAVIRGKVMTRAGAPLPGVVVTVVGHPQFGQTRSRANGEFDLAVNGGALLTVSFDAPGFLTVHRPVSVPWQDFAVVPDVAMIALDTRVTPITANAAAIQVHEGSVETDVSGARKAVLMFAAGTTAQMKLPNGSTVPLTTMNVRATEYTVGPNGPAAMPAPLPRDSAYTYAAEFSVDEAIAAGATRVDFSQPVAVYIDNFLGFPVGGVVPLGAYDRVKALWIPEPNGRVIKITGVTGGLAVIDTVGTTSHPPLVLDAAERQQLAARYSVGTSLWRVVVTHFSPYDPNWPPQLPADAVTPDMPPPTTEPQVERCQQDAGGSIIDCHNQVLRQGVGIAGTEHALAYSGARVPGRTAENRLLIPVSGTSVPASLLRIEVRFVIAGRTFVLTAPAAPNQTLVFDWDGFDAYGRKVQGRQPVTGQIGYFYQLEYGCLDWLTLTPVFGRQCDVRLGIQGRAEGSLRQSFATTVGTIDGRGLGLGGWSISDHHVYDPTGLVMLGGDGTRRSGRSFNAVIDTVAGGGAVTASSGLPAREARLRDPDTVLVGPDGAIYFGNVSQSATLSVNNLLFRIGTDGVLTLVAGFDSPNNLFNGDNLLATATKFGLVGQMAFAPDGTLHFIDGSNRRIRRIGADNRITTVAGTGLAPYNGDDILATQANINPSDGAIVFAPDGTLYFTDRLNHRVRRVGTDGIITTVAGNGFEAFGGDGGPATSASLALPNGMALAPDGSLIIADTGNRRVRRLRPDGIITTIAGTGDFVFNGDGLPATQVNLNGPFSVAYGPDGALYVAESLRIRRIDGTGILTTVAGSGGTTFNGDGIPAASAGFNGMGHIAFDPLGTLYVPVAGAFDRIRSIRLPLPGLSGSDLAIVSDDGRELYRFDRAGRHLSTRHGLTGSVLREFTYDAGGRLATIVEKTGGTDSVTTIQRNAAGQPTAIVGPFGHVTQLALDANGYLSAITSPVGEATAFTYAANGLMQSMTTPRGSVRQYGYDALGRLAQATDPLGGIQTYVRSALPGGHQVVRSTPLGRVTTYKVENLANGDNRLTTTLPAGETETIVRRPNGTNTHTAPDGTVVTTTLTADPRFGMQAAFARDVVTTSPAGLVTTRATTLAAPLTDPLNPFSITQITRTTTTNGQAATVVYTGATRTTVATSPTGRTVTTGLDALGRVVSRQVSGLAPVAYAYDGRGRLVSATEGTGAGSRTTSLAYATDGLLQSTTDPLGRVTQYGRDASGRVRTKTLPGGGVVTFTFDAGGNLAAVAPPGGTATQYAFDARERRVGETPPGGGASSFAFDADGSLTGVTRPDGRNVAFAYDAAGRPVTRQISIGGAVQYTDTVARDGAGRITALVAPGGFSAAFTYDGRLPTAETVTGPVPGQLAQTYDTFRRIASRSLNGSSVAHGYDSDGRLTSAGAMTIVRSAQHGLATSATLGSLTTTFAYNGFGETTQANTSQGATTVFAQTYTRDARGRMVQKTETVGGVTDTYVYAYDVVGRLVSVQRNGAAFESYQYDANGNRIGATVNGVTVTATHDVQDRLLTYGATTFTYTSAGDLAQRTAPGATTAFDYDPQRNLRGATLPGGAAVAYVVDGQGRRAGKRVNGTLVQGFLYQGALRPIAELDGAGNVVTRFVYARGGTPAYMVKGGVTYRLVTDQVGSVRLVVDAATGAIAQRLDYDSFGRVTQDTSPGFQPFGFAGGLYDRDTGLVRFGARDYDPVTGRWTTKDPARFGSGTTNYYVYAGNDPVNRTDRTGHEDQSAAVPEQSVDQQAVIDDIVEVVSGDPSFREHTDSVFRFVPGVSSGAVRNYFIGFCEFYSRRSVAGCDSTGDIAPRYVCTGIAGEAVELVKKAMRDGKISGIASIDDIYRNVSDVDHTAVVVTFADGTRAVLDWHNTLDSSNPLVQTVEQWCEGGCL